MENRFGKDAFIQSFITQMIGSNLYDGLKGGKETMETKSRYEVISELEEKKRALIREKDSFKDTLKMKERQIRESQRELDDDIEDLKDFKDSIGDKEVTIQELIKSIDESLERFSKIEKKK